MRNLAGALVGLALWVLPQTAGADASLTIAAADGGAQIVVYQGLDLALVNEALTVPLNQGENRLTVSWADTPVQADSLRMEIEEASAVSRTAATGATSATWSIACEQAGEHSVALSYLTKGLTFEPCYVMMLDPEHITGHLTVAAKVTNAAKRDFEDVRLRLSIGDVRLGAAAVAAPTEATPAAAPPERPPPLGGLPAAGTPPPAVVATPTAGTQEQFLYVVPGTHDLRDGDALQILLTEADVTLEACYAYDPATYGEGVHRLLTFVNDTEHGLGVHPLMAGTVRTLHRTAQGHLVPLADSTITHVSVGGEAKLDAGLVPDIIVQRKLMDYRIGEIDFDKTTKIVGYETFEQLDIEVRNRTAEPVRLDLTERITGVWSIETAETYEPDGPNAVVFDVDLAPREVRVLHLAITRYHGTRANR